MVILRDASRTVSLQIEGIDNMPSLRFPKSNPYEYGFAIKQPWSGANSLWLTEWLTSECKIEPGMRVLDLACGYAMSSVFLAGEFGVQVWAADPWHDPSENFRLFKEFHVQENARAVRRDAALPYVLPARR